MRPDEFRVTECSPINSKTRGQSRPSVAASKSVTMAASLLIITVRTYLPGKAIRNLGLGRRFDTQCAPPVTHIRLRSPDESAHSSSARRPWRAIGDAMAGVERCDRLQARLSQPGRRFGRVHRWRVAEF